VVDGCRKAVVCPGPTTGWRPILSQDLAAGRHTLVLTLGDGATVERVRFEQKKAAPADYVATLRRLGFDPGPTGPSPAPRPRRHALRPRAAPPSLYAALCGDRVPFDDDADRPPDAGGRDDPGGPEPAPTQPPGPVEPPIGPPILPPQPPGSPTQPTGGGL
jgi:hypothetical protein